MIKVKNLNKYYNKGKSNQIHVINDTSLELPSNGLISFLGHSGSGKTTLLNVIGGLDKASGSIEYDGLEINKYNMHKMDQFRSKHIGYVFQNYNLLKSETVYDNLKIALEVIGVTNLEEIDKRIEYTLKAVGMYKYRKKKAYALSGGQQQRVSIARALVKNCKIIIADEPTGNLDSNNTIEVMNILKKISKDTLVLMVTHETEIAKFYSDYIFELKDGSIINSNNNIGDKILKRDDSNVAYLKDMKKLEYEAPIGNINIYTENDDINSANIDIIIKNGTIFINSNQSIKLVNNTNLKIIDGHYEDIKSEEISEFSYDTSWYRDLKENKHFLKKLWLMIKSSFLTLKNVKKRIKFLYLALAGIGLVWAISIIAITNSTIIDVSNYSYNDNLLTLSTQDYINSIEEAVNQLIDENAITDATTISSGSISFKKNITYNMTIGYENSIYITYYDSSKVTLYKGNEPKTNNEVLISKSEADGIIKQTENRFDYDSIIGENINIGGYSYIICGITINDNKFAYVSFEEYCKKTTSDYNYSYYTGENPGPYYQETDFRYAKNEYKDGKPVYEVVAGRDVDLNSVEREVLVSLKVYNELIATSENPTIDIEYIPYNVVGAFTYPYEHENVYIINKDNYRHVYKYPEYFPNTKYMIVAGRDIEGNNDVIVPSYSKYQIGDEYNNLIVVGKFVGDSDIMNYVLGTKMVAVTYDNAKNVSIEANDLNRVNEILEEYNYLCNYMKQATIEEQKFYMKDVVQVFSILSSVLVIVSAIFIYFIMRSRMISDIYSIGVYRSLGASRLRLYSKTLLDVVILTTFTALIGYTIGIVGYNLIANMVNDYLSASFLMQSNLISILGGICIYILMIVFGMLPILMLLRKTPSEICTKYDI